jgi:hypothetical protein
MGMRWRKGAGTPNPGGASGLADEAEAFLAGTYASHLRSRGVTVPGWAWLNDFAHGDLRGLCEVHRLLTARIPASGTELHEEPWVNAQRLLGRDIPGIVGNDAQLLSRLQDAILVPLELELMSSEAENGLTEYELVQSVRAALRSYIT